MQTHVHLKFQVSPLDLHLHTRRVALMFFLVAAIVSSAIGQQKIKVTGTGQTTGHIANLSITHDGPGSVNIPAQTVYIPSSGQYQSYVATISETRIQPGTTLIPINGYCTDVHLLPVPKNMAMPSIETWIPVGDRDAVLTADNIPVVRGRTIRPFRIADATAITSSAHFKTQTSNSSVDITWPGTEAPVNGIFGDDMENEHLAKVLVTALGRIEHAYDIRSKENSSATPFSITPKKESESIIQQTLWIYAAALNNQPYSKSDFAKRVQEQYVAATGITMNAASAEQKQALTDGIELFWQEFISTGVLAKVISQSSVDVNEVTPVINALAVPWSDIALTGAAMKTNYNPKAIVEGDSKFPLIPVLAGAAGLGVAAVVILSGDGGDDEACAFTIALQPTAANCGQSNGRVTLSTVPAVNYTYAWSNGATTAELNNVPAGVYSVTVSRTGTSCSQTSSATVSTLAPTFTINVNTNNADCGRQNGTATVNVQPAGAYTFQWSNGSSQQNQNNLAAGVYTVTVSSGVACSKTQSVTIGENPFSAQINLSTTPAGCGLANGTITATVNPPGTYNYVWSNGQTGAQATGLVAGSYTVTVSVPGSNCTKTQSITVSETASGFTVAVSSTPTGCGLSDGTATAIVNPPGAYEFAWSNGQTGSQITGLSSGSYSVTVNEPGSTCTQTGSTTVTELPASFTINISTTPAECGLSNGTATATVNPPGSYQYAWSNGQTGSQISGAPSGSYTVTVTLTGTTCSKTANTTIEESASGFTVSVSSTPAGCGLTNGTATATVNPPGSYQYAWSNGQTGSQITGLGSGTYTVTVSVTGSACTQEASTTVNQLPSGFTVSISTTPAGCGLADGTATATANPPGSYEYIWSNGQTGSQISGVGAGAYSVTVTIAGTSCAEQASGTINELPPGFTVSASSTPAGCGLSNGTATATVNPPGTYNYSWSNGQTGAVISNLLPGTYSVTASVSGGNCGQETSVVVDELPATFTLSFNSTPAGCGLSNGSATVTPNPPGAYTYLWSNGGTGALITNVSAGDYTVTVTVGGTSCSSTGTVHVNQTGGGFSAAFTTDNATCGLANGSATVTVSPPGEYNYGWSNGQNGQVLEPVATGTYTVTVENEEGCTESFNVFVGQDVAEYINILNAVPGNCTGTGNITFSATTPGPGPLQVNVNGPGGTNIFSVASGVYSLSAFITVLPGTYTFTVIDESIGSSCSETVNATVNDITPPLEADLDEYETEGAVPVSGNVLENDNGLSLQLTQVDNENGGTVSFTPNGDFTFVADIGFFGEATFTYTVTDACGNTATAIAYIEVEEVPCDIDVVFTETQPSCGFEDGELTATVVQPGDYEFEWSNDESGPTISNIPAGSYFVTITDLTLGCTFEESTLLEGIPSDYVDDINIIHPSCEAGGDIEFTAISPAGNELFMVIQHPNGIADFDIEAGLIHISDYVTTGSGTYVIEISDPDAGPGCFQEFTATLNSPPNLQIVVVEAIPPSEPDEDDGSAFVEVVVPGQFPYAVFVNGTFAFTVSQNNFFIINLEVGVYTVHVVDVNACMSNVEEFEVLPEGAFSFGTGIVQSGLPYESNEKPGVYQDKRIWRSAVTASYESYLGRMPNEIRLRYAIPVKYTSQGYVGGIVDLEFLARLKKLTWKGLDIKLQGGLGGQYGADGLSGKPGSTSAYWLGRAAAGYKLARRIHLKAIATVRGWDKIDPIQCEFSLAVPFYTWRRTRS